MESTKAEKQKSVNCKISMADLFGANFLNPCSTVLSIRLTHAM